MQNRYVCNLQSFGDKPFLELAEEFKRVTKLLLDNGCKIVMEKDDKGKTYLGIERGKEKYIYGGDRNE